MMPGTTNGRGIGVGEQLGHREVPAGAGGRIGGHQQGEGVLDAQDGAIGAHDGVSTGVRPPTGACLDRRRHGPRRGLDDLGPTPVGADWGRGEVGPVRAAEGADGLVGEFVGRQAGRLQRGQLLQLGR